jgi:hypothetical protein
MIRTVEDERSAYVEQIENELSENVVNEIEEEFEDLADEEIVSESKKKESKQEKAGRLVEQARSIVKESDAKGSECRLLLSDDLAEYEDAKMNLKEHGFDTCQALLEKMGHRSAYDEPMEEKPVAVFEAKDMVEPMVIKEVSSGKFTGLLSALIAGSVTAVGLVYLATEKLGMTLDVSKVPSAETTQSLLGSFSEMIGLDPNVAIGAGIFGVSVMSVMGLVYFLRVHLKANSNLHFAVKQFVEAELYAEKKYDCKAEMEKVDAHMKETIKTFKTYEILFNEQQGKLQRILHIEGEKEKASEYHERSYAEIRETKELIRTIKDFMSVSMSDEGKLSQESVERLENVKSKMNKMIDRLYGI